MQLYTEVGHIFYGQNVNEELTPVAKDLGILLTASEVRDRYPFIDTSQYGDHAYLFPHDAGYINPRLVVAAQQKVARQQGCDIIDEVVESVVETSNQLENGQMMEVITKGGATVLAKRVLLCTGVFTELKALLPP